MKPQEIADLAQAEEVCRRFMAWDLSEALSDGEYGGVGVVKERLREVLCLVEESGAEEGVGVDIEDSIHCETLQLR